MSELLVNCIIVAASLGIIGIVSGITIRVLRRIDRTYTQQSPGIIVPCRVRRNDGNTQSDNTTTGANSPEAPAELAVSRLGFRHDENPGPWTIVGITPTITPGEQVPGMRLPKPFKSAFSIAALLKQQGDMTKHDTALQVVLDVTAAFLHQLSFDYRLDQHTGSINFGMSSTREQRVYSIRFDDINIFMQVQLKSLNKKCGWFACVIQDNEPERFLMLETTALMHVVTQQPPLVSQPRTPSRRQRLIDIDGSSNS